MRTSGECKKFDAVNNSSARTYVHRNISRPTCMVKVLRSNWVYQYSQTPPLPVLHASFISPKPSPSNIGAWHSIKNSYALDPVLTVVSTVRYQRGSGSRCRFQDNPRRSAYANFRSVLITPRRAFRIDKLGELEMKHARIVLLVPIFLAPSVNAESPIPGHCSEITSRPALCVTVPPDVVDRAAVSQDLAEQQIAERRQAEYKKQQFSANANKLAELWNAFTREYNEKGTFNVKKARALSKAFHDLEKTEGWPK